MALPTDDGSKEPGSARDEGRAPTSIVLVRHAVTAETGSLLSGRRPGISLSDAGRQQAEAVAAAFSGATVGGVYSSPLERCRETAGAIGRVVERDVVEEAGLVEVDFGSWQGRPLAELAREPLWKVIQAAPSRARFPDGESIATMQARGVAAVEGIVGRHPGETAVVVTHADVIKAVVAQAVGMHLDHYQRLVVAPASCSVLVFGDTRPSLVGFSAPASLAAALGAARPSGEHAPVHGGDAR